MEIVSLIWTRQEVLCCAHCSKAKPSPASNLLRPLTSTRFYPRHHLLSTPRKNTTEMVAILPPLRSTFHTLCSVPPPNIFSGTKTTATVPQLAPHNPHSNHPINTTDGCYNVSPLIHSLASLWFVPHYQPLLEPIGHSRLLAIQSVPAVSTTPVSPSGTVSRLRLSRKYKTARSPISTCRSSPRW